MRKLITLLLTCLVLSAGAQKLSVRIHVLGDSTTEQQNQNLKDQRGWPQLLPHFFTDEVRVLNHGKSGTSSRTFYEERWWKNARETILPGDYVVIQFGHNDEKHGGFDGPIGTVASGSYREYLQKFVDEVRALGAIPIFATPVVRKMGGPGQEVSRRSAHDLAENIAANLDKSVDPADTITFNYPHNMRDIAAINNVPLIDMTRSTKALVDRVGFETATRRIYNFGDGTHICAEGALLFSKLFVLELKSKGILAEYIVDNPPLAVEPAAVDFGEVFQGAEYRQEIDLIVPDEQAAFAGFRIEAGEGVLVSDREFGDYAGELELPAAFDLLYYRRLYLKIAPAAEGAFNAHVRVSAGDRTREIPLKAVARPYPQGEQVSVSYSLNGNEKPFARGPVLAVEHTLGGLVRSSFNQLGAEGIGAPPDPPIHRKPRLQANCSRQGDWLRASPYWKLHPRPRVRQAMLDLLGRRPRRPLNNALPAARECGLWQYQCQTAYTLR